MSSKQDVILANQSVIPGKQTVLEGKVCTIQIGQEKLQSRPIDSKMKATNFVRTASKEFDSIHD